MSRILVCVLEQDIQIEFFLVLKEMCLPRLEAHQLFLQMCNQNHQVTVYFILSYPVMAALQHAVHRVDWNFWHHPTDHWIHLLPGLNILPPSLQVSVIQLLPVEWQTPKLTAVRRQELLVLLNRMYSLLVMMKMILVKGNKAILLTSVSFSVVNFGMSCDGAIITFSNVIHWESSTLVQD